MRHEQPTIQYLVLHIENFSNSLNIPSANSSAPDYLYSLFICLSLRSIIDFSQFSPHRLRIFLPEFSKMPDQIPIGPTPPPVPSTTPPASSSSPISENFKKYGEQMVASFSVMLAKALATNREDFEKSLAQHAEQLENSNARSDLVFRDIHERFTRVDFISAQATAFLRKRPRTLRH